MDRNSGVWSDKRRDTGMGHQEEWRSYEKGCKEARKKGSTAIPAPFLEIVNFLNCQEKKMSLKPTVRVL